jgi:hypothetical protein
MGQIYNQTCQYAYRVKILDVSKRSIHRNRVNIMNNNTTCTRALEAHCKGVFEKTGYITIGTPE